MSDIFISYSRQDTAFVRTLHTALSDRERDIWVDWEDIPLTADWRAEIYRAIEAANTFMFVISPDSIASQVCNEELAHAIQYNKRLVPILHRKVDTHLINSALSAVNFVYFRSEDDFDSTLEALLKALDTDLAYTQRHTRLLVRAIEWNSNNRDTSFVLRGSDLAEAESWLVTSASKQPEPTDLHLQYINTSRRAANARQRVTVGALSFGIVLSLALAAFGFYQSDIAQKEANNRATAEAVALNEADSRATAQNEAVNQAEIAQRNEATAVAAQATAERSAEEAQSQALAAAAQLTLGEDNGELAIALGLAANTINNPPPQAQRILAEAAYRPGERRILYAYAEGVTSLDVSSDGHYIVSGGCNEKTADGCISGVITLWNTANSSRIWENAGFSDEVKSVAFSPDDSQIAFAYCADTDADNTCTRGDMRIVDTENGEEIQRFDGHNSDVNQVRFSPDGMLLASAAADGLVVWEVASGERAHHFGIGGGEQYLSVAFSPDGRTIAGGTLLQINLFELETEEVLKRFFIPMAKSLEFNGDGSLLLVPSINHQLFLVNIDRGEQIRNFVGHNDDINSVAFSPDGRYATSGAGGLLGAERSIILWDVETGALLYRFEGHGTFNQVGANNIVDIYGVTAVLFSPNGRAVISGGGDGTIRSWDIEDGAIRRRLARHDLTVNAVAYSPDGRFIASGSSVAEPGVLSEQGTFTDFPVDGVVNLSDAVTGALIQTFRGQPEAIQSLAFSPDGEYLASGSWDGEVIIWKVPTGDIVWVLEGEDSSVVWGVTYSADGRYIISGGFKGEVVVWDASTGQMVLHLEGAGPVAVMRDLIVRGEYLYARGQNDDGYQVIKWNIETGELVSKLSLGNVKVSAMDVSPDERYLLVGTSDGVLRLFDLQSGEPVGGAFVGHEGGILEFIQKVAFSPDGRYALSGAYDTTMILWDINTGQALRRFRGHTSIVNTVAFSPDGRRAISGGSDNAVIEWRIDTLSELITWTYANRYVREPSCNERIQFQLVPVCEDDATYPTRTPYPTLTPTGTFTPSPTVDLTRVTVTPTATVTPTFTATATRTPAATFTPTSTPETLEAIPLSDLDDEVAVLELSFEPLLPPELPNGLLLYGVSTDVSEADDITPGGLTFALILSTDPKFNRDNPRQILAVYEYASPYATLDEWAHDSTMSSFFQRQTVAGHEVAVLAVMESFVVVNLVYGDLFLSVSSQDVDAAILEEFLIMLLSSGDTSSDDAAMVVTEAAVPTADDATIQPKSSPTVDVTNVDDAAEAEPVLPFTPLLPDASLVVMGYQISNVTYIYPADLDPSLVTLAPGDVALQIALTGQDPNSVAAYVFESLSSFATLDEWKAAAGISEVTLQFYGTMEYAAVNFNDGALMIAFIHDGVFVSIYSADGDQRIFFILAALLPSQAGTPVGS